MTNNLLACVTAPSDHVSAFSCMLALLWSPTRHANDNTFLEQDGVYMIPRDQLDIPQTGADTMAILHLLLRS